MRPILDVAATVLMEDIAQAAGCSKAELMARAGAAVARQAQVMAPEGRIVVLTGFGNNGGDGWVAAQSLLAATRQVEVLSVCDPGRLKGIAFDAAHAAIEAGVPVFISPDVEKVGTVLSGASLAIDGILGTGFSGSLREPLASWLRVLAKSERPVLAIDVPSGLEPDTGTVAVGGARATCTLACMTVKPGMLGGAGGAACGRVMHDALGVDDLLPGVYTAHALAQEGEASDFAALIPHPDPGASKYTRGAVLVVAGSLSFPGAAVLCSKAATRSGAGYVTLAAPEPIVGVLQAHLVSVPVVAMPARDGAFDATAVDTLIGRCAKARSVVFGPGVTRTVGARMLLDALLRRYPRPLVVDADGLFLLAQLPDAVAARRGAAFPLVVTPHAGEMLCLMKADLTGAVNEIVASDVLATPMGRVAAARAMAVRLGATVVLKGPGTVVTDANEVFISGVGTSALATAGTGDILAGMLGALLAQGLTPVDAASLAVHIHGLAGREAASRLTEMCVTAEDVCDAIPAAVAQLLV
jgi:hydroxyethylthiazole kinase-like uncharacterized protein yjeF